LRRYIDGKAFPDAHVRWCTGDIFREVETDEGVYLEHCCREDDILLHTTGEMTNPLITEDVITQRCPWVQRACVIGNMQPAPSLVVELVPDGGHKPPPTNATKLLWAAVKEANSKQPGYSAVKKDKIVVLLPGVSLPVSMKGNVIRKLVEKEYREGGAPTDDDGSDNDGAGGGSLAPLGLASLGVRNSARFAAIDAVKEGEDTAEDSEGSDLDTDSLGITRRSKGGDTAGEGAIVGHIYCMCMANVILRHTCLEAACCILPGVTVSIEQYKRQLISEAVHGVHTPCEVTSMSQFFIHATNPVAMPGFSLVAGYLDYKRSKFLPLDQQCQLLLRQAAVLMGVYALWRKVVIPGFVAYIDPNITASELDMSGMWFLLALALAKLCLVGVFAGRVSSWCFAAIALLAHLGCWGQCTWPLVRDFQTFKPDTFEVRSWP
jgi:hypothetical protein